MMIPYNRNRAVAPYRAARGLTRGAMYGAGASLAYKYGKRLATIAHRYVYKKKQATQQVTNPSSSSIKTIKKRGGRKYRKMNIKKLARVVKQVKQQIDNTTGTLVHKLRSTGRSLASGANVISLDQVSAFTVSFINDTVMPELRYYDPATPGTYVQANFATGTQSKEVMVKAFSNLVLRNNYRVPTKVTVWLVRPKQDTSTGVASSVTNGLADIGGVSGTAVLTWPTDSPQFKELFKTLQVKTTVLAPGAQFMLSNKKIPWFRYDPSEFDSQSDTLQPRYFSHQYLIRCEGVLGHDSAQDEQGQLRCGVDWMLSTTTFVKYPAGANLIYHVHSIGNDSFTNAGQVSMPDIEQEQYSL